VLNIICHAFPPLDSKDAAMTRYGLGWMYHVQGSGMHGEQGSSEHKNILTPTALESLRTKIIKQVSPFRRRLLTEHQHGDRSLVMRPNTQICAASHASLVLTKEGEVWQWGYRLDASGAECHTFVPYRLTFNGEPIVSISACYHTFAAVDQLGFVYMWGHMPEPQNITWSIIENGVEREEQIILKLTEEHYVDQPILLESAADFFILDVQVSGGASPSPPFSFSFCGHHPPDRKSVWCPAH